MPPELSPALDEFISKHEALLTQLHAQSGAVRWEVSFEEFAGALHRSAAHHFGRAGPAAEEFETHLRGLHLDDIALACALRCGSEQAWKRFVDEYRPILYSSARAIVGAAGEAHARELADSLYAELFGLKSDDTGRTSLLGYFHGRSKLATWLRSILAQRHVDNLRASKRTEQLDDCDTGLTRPAPSAITSSPDPDRDRLLPRLRRAVSLALGNLAASDRLLLSLYYVEDLTLAQIARLRGIHEATASRHLARVAREVRDSVERALAEGLPPQNGKRAEPALSAAEIERCFTYALEDWGLDLQREITEPVGGGT